MMSELFEKTHGPTAFTHSAGWAENAPLGRASCHPELDPTEKAHRQS